MPSVVHVYKDYWPPVLGGIERTVNWMCTELVRRGWEATALVNSRSRETRERVVHGVRVIEVGEWGRAFSAPLSPSLPGWLRRLRADVWHFHIPNPTGDFSALAMRPRGAWVATYHSDIVRQRWALWAYGPFLRAFLRRCGAIMPTSPHLIESSPFLRPLAKACSVVPLGLPLEPFDRSAEAAQRARAVKARYKGFPLLVFLGKLRYYKGLQYLVSAMRGLPHARLAVIGEGPEGEKLQRLAVDFDVADRIEFLGELPDPEVVAHLHAADLFILPSHLPSEAYGLVQIEAMAAGLPVVSTDLPTGVPFVNQHGVTGLVVPPADDQALAAAIAELLGDTSRRLAMAEAAHRRAREMFSVAAMVDGVEAAYAKALKRPGSG